MDMEFSGKYPIIIDGSEKGEIEVLRDGLFWCFEATSEMADGILRLSVYGDGKEGYLGIMEPCDGKLKLKKRFSRSALAAFPAQITHAGRRGESQKHAHSAPEHKEPEKPTAPVALEPQHHHEPEPRELHEAEVKEPEVVLELEEQIELERSSNASGWDTPMKIHHSNLPTQGPPRAPHNKGGERQGLVWRRCGTPASFLSTMEGKSLFGSQPNVMEAVDGDFIYLAIPVKTAVLSPHQRGLLRDRTSILGEDYWVCKVKDGKIL